jgi:cyclophilin family peptidyl-prolyl cis-trans isomerase
MMRSVFCVVPAGLVFCLVTCLLVSSSVAAEAPQGEPEKPAAAKADAKPDAAAKPAAPKEEPKPAAPAKTEAAKEEPKADAAAPKPGPTPAEAFTAKMNEWKEVLKELRKLKSDYAAAAPDKTAEIETKWNETVAKGEKLIPELRETGKQAFLAAPNQDHEVMHFLTKMVASDAARDDYEPAADMSQTLLENGCTEKDLYEPAGIAAFATNDFEKAEKYLKKAAENGSLGENAKKAQDALKDYPAYWKKEQELRKQDAEKDDLPRVKLTTSKGDIVVELFENEAPGAVGNFISLVEKGFYNGLVFHRVLEGFMAQGGCPNGDGKGGPGYTIRCECYQDNARKHFRGSLSMAHAGKDTGGSQFFLTFVPTAHLNGKHTVFGRVIEGMEVLAKLRRINPDAKGDKPTPDKIIEAKVIRKRDHEYKPNKTE